MRAASLLVFLALAGSAAAAVIGSGEHPTAEARVLAAEGSFSFANSRDGMPIFSATEIAPGDSVGGTVEIANTGSEPGELVLSEHDVADVAGPGGGALSGRLTVRIADVTALASPVGVYAGPLAPMPPRPAGVLAPGESRTYEFVATLPQTGPAGGGQNDVQGASASVAYRWTAGEAIGSEPVPPAGPGSGSGEPPSSAPSAPAGPPPAGSQPPAAAPLRLAITRVRRTLHRGHLLVWARCDSACSIAAHGRLRARGPAGRRGANLRLTPHPRFATGTQLLSIPIPGHLRHWLEANPGPLRATARLALLARDQVGMRATARRSLRVLPPRQASDRP